MPDKKHCTLSLFLFCCLCLGFFPHHSPAQAAGKTALYCVVDPITPVTGRPGVKYSEAKLSGDGYYLPDDNPEIRSVAVYGNYLRAKPATGSRAEGWMELVGVKGANPGFIPKKSLRPLPAYNATEKKYFWTKKDNPALFLLPGERPLSGIRAFSLLRGETLTSVGEMTTKAGERWLLFAFDTVPGTGEPGVSARYAWGREDGFLRLEAYKPNYGELSAQNIPTRVRGNYLNAPEGFKTDPATQAALAKHGFRIAPAPIIRRAVTVDDMADSYNEHEEFVPAFVTTDMFFHAWHLISSRFIQKTEEKYLSRALERYLIAALAQLDEREKKISAAHPRTPREAIQTARDMLTLPLALLSDPKLGIEKRLSPAAAMEYDKIMSARGRGNSAVTGGVTDYTQYRPRSHYTSTPALSRYFRAMSFLGDAAIPLGVKNGREARLNASAIALLCLITDTPPVKGYYNELARPLRMMMGEPDDNSFDDYTPVVRKVLAGYENNVLTEEISEKLREALTSAAHPPKIPDKPASKLNMTPEERAEEQAGFRVFGKRFAYDAYIFSRLTSPSVGTPNEPRSLPRPEDVMAVLGSKSAYELTASYAEKYRGYGTLRRLLTEQASAPSHSLADDTLYAASLRALSASFEDSRSPQFFCRPGGNWEWKKLLTASASWTELKHTSVLYVKQSGAEVGGVGELIPGEYEPPRPRGYVEPAPQAFRRLAEASGKLGGLLKLMASSSLRASDAEYSKKLSVFSELCESARAIAEKESRGQPITQEDYLNIEALSRAFTPGLLLPGEMFGPADDKNTERLRMALAADVATDYADNRVLYAATGAPRRIFVFVDDNSAGPRFTVGYVYSYYEFERPADKARMTDGEWKKLVYDAKRRDELETLRPAWYKNLLF